MGEVSVGLGEEERLPSEPSLSNLVTVVMTAEAVVVVSGSCVLRERDAIVVQRADRLVEAVVKGHMGTDVRSPLRIALAVALVVAPASLCVDAQSTKPRFETAAIRPATERNARAAG